MLVSKHSRRAALSFASGVGIVLPVADASIDTADRALLLGCFFDAAAGYYHEEYSANSEITRSTGTLDSYVTRAAALNSKLDD